MSLSLANDENKLEELLQINGLNKDDTAYLGNLKNTILTAYQHHIENAPSLSISELQNFEKTASEQITSASKRFKDHAEICEGLRILLYCIHAILNLFCNQQLKLKGWIAQFFVNACTNCMRQHFSDNSVC